MPKDEIQRLRKELDDLIDAQGEGALVDIHIIEKGRALEKMIYEERESFV